MGFDKDRRPLTTPRLKFDEEGSRKFASASSAGATIGPRGSYVLYGDSSAGGAAPKVMYLNTPQLGDYIEFYLGVPCATSNGVAVRTSTSGSGTYIGATSCDNILMSLPGQGFALRALSSAAWLLLSAPNSSIAAPLGVSTS